MNGSVENAGLKQAVSIAAARTLKRPSPSLLRKLGPEAQEQIALIEWAEAAKVPRSSDSISKHLIYINNGGKRSRMAGYIAKLMGEKPGASDLLLALPRGGMHGLFIELKAKRGKPSEDQTQFLHDRAEQGYMAVLCFGWDSARSVITDYLGLANEQHKE